MKTSALIIVLLCGLNLILAHNWLSSPVSRGNQAQSQTGCRVGGEGGVNCPGPCDRTVAQMNIAPTVIQRGSSLNIHWNMHTHEGGFIRFAWCPTSQSDSKDCFNQNVQQFNCKEIGGCNPNNPDCSTTITAPAFLTEGAWTLQWAYFGGWFNAGDYYACVDYTVSGGSSVAAKQAATFVGGDYNNPSTNVCQYYSTNALGQCVSEPCNNATYPGGVAQTGAPQGFNAGDAPYTSVSPITPPTPSPQPATTGRVAPATTHAAVPATTRSVTSQAAPITSGQRPITSAASPITSGMVKPVTSGAQPITSGMKPLTTAAPSPITSGMVKPLTTGAPRPATTSRPLPATTGAKPLTTGAAAATPVPVPTPVPTPAPVPITPPTSASCVSGYMKCLPDGSYSTCNHEVWGPSQPCGPSTTCSQSGNYIYCILGSPPTSTPTTPSPVSTPVPTPTPAPVPTPITPSPAAPSSTPSSSVQTGSCTLGYQLCVGDNTYQTCGNGRDGPVWAGVQQCQTGLSCHQSSTANNIYCY